MAKSLSRPERWAQACATIRAGIEQLREGAEALEELRGEYEEWRDNLPDNMQDGATADKLNEVADVDVPSSEIDDLESRVDELEGMDLPRGFGRD